MRPKSRFRFARGLAMVVAVAVAVLMLDCAVNYLMAQTPFGGPRPKWKRKWDSGLMGTPP